MKGFHKTILFSIFTGFLILASAFLIFSPHTASAHEVYVLSTAQIKQAVSMPSFNMFAVISHNLKEFTFWAFIGILAVFCVFFISILRFLERALDPFFIKLRPYAPFVSRVTVGLSFIAAAYYQAAYGPELPLHGMFGSMTSLVTVILVVIGIMIILGLYARISAGIALLIYAVSIWFHGWYMLTYINYLGEILVMLILGAHSLSLDRVFLKGRERSGKLRGLFKKFHEWLIPRSFAILRVCFGISLIVASTYAKIIHNNLGLSTVMQYHLDTILGFEPHFLVLGAAIVEILIGTFTMLGFEIRFTSLFFEFWLTMSLLFFGEIVWPHIILIGIPIALIMYGYDSYSVEGYFFRKKKYEPVL